MEMAEAFISFVCLVSLIVILLEARRSGGLQRRLPVALWALSLVLLAMFALLRVLVNLDALERRPDPDGDPGRRQLPVRQRFAGSLVILEERVEEPPRRKAGSRDVRDQQGRQELKGSLMLSLLSLRSLMSLFGFSVSG